MSRRITILALTGLTTCFFGFAFGALVNSYLLSVHSSLVLDYRSALTFKSAIYGDGLILPMANIVAVNFLLDHKKAARIALLYAIILGLTVTIVSQYTQASRGLVDWSMPTPWHWNFLGFWHMAYMFSVSTLLSLFYFSNIWVMIKEKRFRWEIVIVTALIFSFLALLDYDFRLLLFS